MRAKVFAGLGLALALVLALSPIVKAELWTGQYPILIHGHVYDSEGGPMSGVRVRLLITLTIGFTAMEIRTLDDGYYQFYARAPLADPSVPARIEFIAEDPYIYGSGSIPAWDEVIINAYAEGSTFRLEYLRPIPPPEPIAEPEPIAVEVDIDPDTLNLKSKGKWITAYIELPDGYSATDVDPSTIRLNGVVPAVADPKYGFIKDPKLMDCDGDDLDEFMVKFDRSAVQAIVGVGEVTLTITGMVGGVPFEGSDTIRVVG